MGRENNNHVDNNKVGNNHVNNERKSFFLVGLAYVIFGCIAFQYKFSKIFWPQVFEPNLFVFFRSLSTFVISVCVLKYKNIKLVPVDKINSKFALFGRTVGFYLALFTFMTCLSFLRTSTVSSMNCTHPALVVVLSTIFLKEKFHMRYIIGISVCFLGTMMLIMNENKSSKVNVDASNELNSENLQKIIIGVSLGCVNLFFHAISTLSSKILVSENIFFENQTFYIGLTNMLCCLVYIFFSGVRVVLDFTFILSGLVNGVIFYLGTVCLLEGLKGIDVSKTSPLPYINTITVFLLSVIFLGEPVYFTDVLGSGIILVYNIYNSTYPIKN